MPHESKSKDAVNTTSRAAANNQSSSGVSHAAVLPVQRTAKVPAQLQKLDYATGENYKLRAHQGTKSWMALIELDKWGAPPGWHLSIFPTGQDGWDNHLQVVKGSYKPIYSKPWMEYDEFHITDDKGTHFFYTDGCVPIEGGTRGESASWQNPLWASANYLVALYFGANREWLDNYINEQIGAKIEEKKNLVSEEKIWKEYLEAAKEDPSLHAADGWDKFRAAYQQQ